MTARTPRTHSASEKHPVSEKRPVSKSGSASKARAASKDQPDAGRCEQLSLLFDPADGDASAPILDTPLRASRSAEGSPAAEGTRGSEGTRSVAPNPHPPAPTTTRHRWGTVVLPEPADHAVSTPVESGSTPVKSGERADAASRSETGSEARRESFPEKLARWKRESGEAVRAKARRWAQEIPGVRDLPGRRRDRVGAPPSGSIDAQSHLYERARVFLATVPEADQRPQPSLEVSLQHDESWTGLVISLGLIAAAFATAFLIA